MSDMITTELLTWSWVFLFLYIGGMLLFGYMGQRRVKSADDFATARGGYGPVFLAFAFAATTASGATFIGLPGIGYKQGLSSLWVFFLYPFAVYFGVIICMTVVARAGGTFGSRSIPEYLGDRYQSDNLRILVAICSLLLFFYLAGQLVSCLVLFGSMLGLPPIWALVITCGVLLIYVMAGGAHADILTDGVQGMLMLLLALLITYLFITGHGIEGGLSGLIENLNAQNPLLTDPMSSANILTNSWWAIFCLIFAVIPLGLLPHLGNKLWALKDVKQRWRFVQAGFVMAMIMPAIGLGGILARGLLGESLFESGVGGNYAIPALFIELFPTWVAALLGVGVLSAVMSTADGLVISCSQVLANDIYRRTIAPRWHADQSNADIEARTLVISRVATFLTLLISAILAWNFMDMNVVFLVWIGLGGMMAALTGPLLLGSLWRGVTSAGATVGFVIGAVMFIVLHSGIVDTGWVTGGDVLSAGLVWLLAQGPNPYTCATVSGFAGILGTVIVSLFSQKLPEDHIKRVFNAS